jgi:hypothetical protein
MKVCMLSSVHSADDIRIVEKEARSLSKLGHHAMPGRIFVKLKKHHGEIFSQRANA